MEDHTLLLAKPIQVLDIIVRHHQVHLSHRETVEKAQVIVDRLQCLAEIENTGQRTGGNSAAHELALAISVRDDAGEHLRTCSARLSSDAASFSVEVQEVIDGARRVRHQLVG